MEYIITFKNTNSAIKAEQCLLALGLSVTVLPLPSQIGAGCGICLKVGRGEISPALKSLDQAQIHDLGLYSLSPGERKDSPGVYAKIEDLNTLKKQRSDPTMQAELDRKKSPVVVISKNAMGDGAEDLGNILIKSFIASLAALETPPDTVIFVNSGVQLAAQGANTISDLKALEEKGVKLLACGTCVNYYELQDKLAVGTVTNMQDIASRMTAATNVINI